MAVNREPTADELNGVKQDTVHWPAKALRVTLIDSDGNNVKFRLVEENRLGSECSGTEPNSGRVLTLVNTRESGNPVSVWVESQLIAATDYTVSHLTASSTITFGGMGIFDADNIRVMYYD